MMTNNNNNTDDTRPAVPVGNGGSRHPDRNHTHTNTNHTLVATSVWDHWIRVVVAAADDGDDDNNNAAATGQEFLFPDAAAGHQCPCY
jgi:phosphoglucomutase